MKSADGCAFCHEDVSEGGSVMALTTEPAAIRVCLRCSALVLDLLEASKSNPVPLPPKRTRRECTCVDRCKGAAGLAPGWFCVMSPTAPTRCKARKALHPAHLDDACTGDCCTTCGGPISATKRCLCG